MEYEHAKGRGKRREEGMGAEVGVAGGLRWPESQGTLRRRQRKPKKLIAG